MKEVLHINQNFKFYYGEDKNEKFCMKIIDITIGFALVLVLFFSVYSHYI